MPKRLIYFLGSIFMRITTRIVVLGGTEYIPKDGAGIIVFNHLGHFEAPLIYIMVNRLDMTGWVADKYLDNLLIRVLVKWLDGIWLNREGADVPALKRAQEYLRDGRLLGIAPEGTRSPTGSLIEGKKGVAYLAAKSGVPLIPIAVTGSELVVSAWLKLRRPSLKIRFGEPFTLPKLDRKTRTQALQDGTDEIMCRIAAMLPREYRGIYSQHPRLKQILSEDAM
ncbi:MAG: 1-acyl-sn-glycerol-3-phosphate acyltransferase [Chloroflexota bacterium]